MMAKRLKINSKALIKAVESGLPKKEIMARFGIKNYGQIKPLYVDALIKEGKIKGIVMSRKSKNPGKDPKQIVVNKRGSLIIPREMIEEMGFEVGESFVAIKTEVGVSLK
ncbi:MAG: hypothetical protein JRG97_02870, partial [Deltaproteobacteria bacterium]|nr:hypothetical protein [Deltaproteobacteria bacterium]